MDTALIYYIVFVTMVILACTKGYYIAVCMQKYRTATIYLLTICIIASYTYNDISRIQNNFRKAKIINQLAEEKILKHLTDPDLLYANPFKKLPSEKLPPICPRYNYRYTYLNISCI